MRMVSYEVQGFYGVSRSPNGRVRREWKTWVADIPETQIELYRKDLNRNSVEELGDWYLATKYRIVRVTKDIEAI